MSNSKGPGGASGVAAPQPTATAAQAMPVIGAAIPAVVLALHAKHKQLQTKFSGTAKLNSSATPTPGHYDEAYVEALIWKEVVDRDDLATALFHRPDGHAQQRGAQYIAAVVDKALLNAVAAAEAEVQAAIDFEVEQIEVLKSDKSTYFMTVRFTTSAGVKRTGRFELDHEQLVIPAKFKSRFSEAMTHVPRVPKVPGATWDDLVNSWFERAVVHRLDSERASFHQDVRTALARLKVGKDEPDLQRGAALLINGGTMMVFRTVAVVKRIRQSHPNVPVHKYGTALKSLGYAYKKWPIGKRVRTKAWGGRALVQAPDEAADSAPPFTPPVRLVKGAKSQAEQGHVAADGQVDNGDFDASGGESR